MCHDSSTGGAGSFSFGCGQTDVDEIPTLMSHLGHFLSRWNIQTCVRCEGASRPVKVVLCALTANKSRLIGHFWDNCFLTCQASDLVAGIVYARFRLHVALQRSARTKKHACRHVRIARAHMMLFNTHTHDVNTHTILFQTSGTSPVSD